ncbi:MAG: MBL fold metallo-hydrolase [Armatimonadetes bacterium]|nr:MBL fold metallo-hydrolase [Armatimonadota bacterium]
MKEAQHSSFSKLQATFLGAAGEVTGSCTLLDTPDGLVLVDCGMYQGHHTHDQVKRAAVSPVRIRCVLLTHAHLDHCGLLPWLGAHGFSGPIFATPGTRDLAQIILADSARLQEEEAAYRRRHGRKTDRPLYTERDVERLMPHFVGIDYNWPFEPVPSMTVDLHDAGHILGAASLHLTVGEREIVFSGDIGHRGRPILRDPDPPPSAHTVVTEATYGDRLQPSPQEATEQLLAAMLELHERGGVAVIPSFAVGRTQTLLYEFEEMMRLGKMPRLPIFLDSPMAIEACAIFRRYPQYFDDDARALLAQGIDPLAFDELHFCRTVDQSKALNDMEGPAVIIAGSGMCTGGRVRHHLRQRLSRPEDMVIFVGYQAQGTLGRVLVEGAEKVKLYGEWVPVRARVTTVHGYSAHADQAGLLAWLQSIHGVEQVLINHAEPDAASVYADLVHKRLGLKAHVVSQFESVDL